jgi:hypothetical protein
MNLLAKLSSLLQDGSGDQMWSTTRFSFLFTVLISNIVIFGVWAAVCYHTRQIVSIPSGVLSIYLAANGITATSKIVQKHFETRAENTAAATQTLETEVPVEEVKAEEKPVGDA